MDWLFDNIGTAIPLIIGLIYFLSSLKNREGRDEEQQSPEAQERARRIQEEIRRKILERQGEAPQPRAEPQPTIEFIEEEEVSEPPAMYNPQKSDWDQGPPEPEPVIVPEYNGPSPQELYAEQRREVERRLQEAQKLKQSIASQEKKRAVQGKRATEARWTSASLRNSLGDPKSIRQAIVLKEVLDKPIALREG